MYVKDRKTGSWAKLGIDPGLRGFIRSGISYCWTTHERRSRFQSRQAALEAAAALCVDGAEPVLVRVKRRAATFSETKWGKIRLGSGGWADCNVVDLGSTCWSLYQFTAGARADLRGKRAGIRRVGWHVLRHTFASHLAMKAVPILTIRDLLGHADIKQTLRYAHLAPSMHVEAVKLLDQETQP